MVDPCATTTITPNVFAAISAQVFGTPSTASATWADGVSLSASNGFLQCGNLVFTTIVVTSPSTYVEATMNIMFSYLTSGLTTTLTVTPILVAEVGVYSVTTKACLADNPTNCVTSAAFSVTILTYCTVTSV